MNVKKFAGRVLASGLVLAAGVASAAPTAAIDVADVTTSISNQLAPIGLVGAGILGLHVAVKAYKWIRAALS